MKSIFKRLEENGVRYGIGVAVRTFKACSEYGNSKDYFVFISEKDSPKVAGWNFIKSENSGILERDFTDEDYYFFTEIKGSFVEKKFKPHGSIFERKVKPFKPKIKNDKSRRIL